MEVPMHKKTQKNNLVGKLEVFEDLKQKIFLARPHGVINPSLLSKDLDSARHFSNEVRTGWSYVTDTSDVKLVNPLNLLYLKEVKKIKNLKQIVIFAPNPINRVLIYLASPIIQPDRVIKERKEFENFLHEVK
jgi:hypothetical protein